VLDLRNEVRRDAAELRTRLPELRVSIDRAVQSRQRVNAALSSRWVELAAVTVVLAACVNQDSRLVAPLYRQAADSCAKQGKEVKYGKLTYVDQRFAKSSVAGGVGAAGGAQANQPAAPEPAHASLDFKCVSTETKITQLQVQAGVTTEAQVIAALGPPMSTSTEPDGTKTDVYVHVAAAATGASNEQVGGAGGAPSTTDTVTFTFDAHGVLTSTTSSASQAHTGPANEQK
jgi:hypothetical protein